MKNTKISSVSESGKKNYASSTRDELCSPMTWREEVEQEMRWLSSATAQRRDISRYMVVTRIISPARAPPPRPRGGNRTPHLPLCVRNFSTTPRRPMCHPQWESHSLRRDSCKFVIFCGRFAFVDYIFLIIRRRCLSFKIY